MINKNDIDKIETLFPPNEKDTRFQSFLKDGFYRAAQFLILEDSIESFLEEFEIPTSTLVRWIDGTSVPNSNIQNLVMVWWKKQMENKTKTVW